MHEKWDGGTPLASGVMFMTMELSFREIEEIREHIDALPGPVNLILVRESATCDDCQELEKFAKELTMLSHNFRFDVLIRSSDPARASRYGIDITPALIVNGLAGGRIRFFGIPTTSELATFLRTVKEAAHGQLNLAPLVRHKFSNLLQPLHIRVLVPYTCIFCPDVVAMAQKLAFAYNQVTVDVVNLKNFPDLAKHYHAQTEPKVLVNDKFVPVTTESESKFAEMILEEVGKSETRL